MLKLFDSHCHLYFPQFDADRVEVLQHMSALDIGAIVVGTDFETSKAALELAAQHDFLWVSVGLHPNDEERFDTLKYEELAKNKKVVAVGECGLDYFRSEKSDGQRERFEAQIALAQKIHKPLIIHCRNAHEDMLEILKTKKLSIPVIMHFFTGTAELAQKYLDLGCHLSFPGPITYTDMYDESVRMTPLDKILVETDAPFAAPVPHRGQRNEPAYVEHVIRKIAILKEISFEDAARQITYNSQHIFGLHG